MDGWRDRETTTCELCGDALEAEGTEARRQHLEVEEDLLTRIHDMHGGDAREERSCSQCIALYRGLDRAIPRVTFSACCG